jgi:heme-degrading monooxygenase HmoA
MQVNPRMLANFGSMFMVVSHWRPKPGKEAEFEAIGREARSRMRNVDGIEFLEAIHSGDEIVVVHAYRDYETYSRVAETEDGEVARNMAELGVEEAGEWLGSERGECLR